MADAELLLPEEGLEPRVYYRNIPKKFIAGTVYDPVKKEVIRGAVCALNGTARRSDADRHDRRLRGFLVRRAWMTGPTRWRSRRMGSRLGSFPGLSTERDINLGDIPLS